MRTLRLLLLGWLLPALLSAAPVWTIENNNFRVSQWNLLSPKSDTEPLKAVFLLQPVGRAGRSSIAVYSLPENGEPQALWRYAIPQDIPAQISSFAITDLDKNNQKELALIIDGPGTDIPWLMLFEENRSGFSNQPVSSSKIPIEGTNAPRPLQILNLADFWNQQQILVLFGGSVRKAISLTPKGRLTDNRWSADRLWFSPQFLTGASVLNAMPLFPDKLRSSEDVLIMSTISNEPYFALSSQNRQGENVVKGELRGKRYDLSGRIIQSTQLISRENVSHFIFYTDNGHLAQLSTSASGELSIRSISKNHRIGALSNPSASPKNHFHFVSDDGKKLFKSSYDTGKKQFSVPEPILETGVSGQPVPTLQMLPTDKKNLYLAVSDKKQIFVERLTIEIENEDKEDELQALLEELSAKLDTKNDKPSPDTVEAAPDSIILPPGFVIKDALLPALEIVDTSETVLSDTLPTAENMPDPEPELTETIPNKRALYDRILYVGDEFLENVPLAVIDPGTFNMEWNAPEGASFNFQTRQIRWKVNANQLGQHKIDLAISDRNQQTDNHWRFYVNDKPKITNSKRAFIINVFEPLELPIAVADKNDDARQWYQIDGLPSAQIDSSGLLTWVPDEKALDINLFTIWVDDGFDRDSVHFMVYVNDPVQIVSAPPNTLLPVEKSWYYSIKTEDRNTSALYQIKFNDVQSLSPFRKNIDSFLAKDIANVETVAYQRQFINIRPFVENVQLFENSLFLTLSDKPDELKTSFGELLAGILATEVKSVPKYAAQQLKQLKFKLEEGPETIKLSADGQLFWTPSYSEIDSQLIVISAGDGISQRFQKIPVYVNAPPMISSKAKSAILHPGEIFTYQCTAIDSNRNAQLNFRLSAKSPPADLDENGFLTWRVKDDQYDYDQLTIIVSDGYVSDQITLMIYVNDPIKIIPSSPRPALVQQPWQHQVKYLDRNKSTLYRIRVEDIGELAFINDKIENFLQRQSVMVQKQQPRGSVNEMEVRTAVKHAFSFGPDLFIEKNPNYHGNAKISDLFAGILNLPPESLPKFREYQDWRAAFKLLEQPRGMTISQSGLIQWTPEPTQFDSFFVKFSVTDGIVSDTGAFTVFVNSPPKILSRPDSLIHIGKTWNYPVILKDHNKNQPLHLTLVEAPDGMKLNDFSLSWKPEPQQKGQHIVSFLVDDGYQKAGQTFSLLVNLPPVFTSKPLEVAMTGFPYSYQISAQDPNGDSFKYFSLEMPKLAELDPVDGQIRWNPRSPDRGLHQFKVKAIDEHGLESIHEWQVEVFSDPTAKKFSLALFPMMITFTGILLMVTLL
jgi:hypothetical protein